MDDQKLSRILNMNRYILYLSPKDNNKIRYFYLVDQQEELMYMGNLKISNYSDSLKNLKDYVNYNDNYFLIIPIDEEKFHIFSDMKYSYIKDMDYKNFLKTYNLYEWII